jgi:rhodanese-related sulfurtransferase
MMPVAHPCVDVTKKLNFLLRVEGPLEDVVKKLILAFVPLALVLSCASTQSAESTGHAVQNPQAEERMKEVAKQAAAQESNPQEVEAYRQIIDPQKGKKLVQTENAPLIDVRPASQFNTRHLAGAKNIPLAEMEKGVDGVAALNGGDKKKPVVLYCNSGRTAAQAKALLEAQGFSNVVSAGGMDDWPAETTPTGSAPTENP